jgi:hypothetical protein
LETSLSRWLPVRQSRRDSVNANAVLGARRASDEKRNIRFSGPLVQCVAHYRCHFAPTGNEMITAGEDTFAILAHAYSSRKESAPFPR